jgi:hypothetical protein
MADLLETIPRLSPAMRGKKGGSGASSLFATERRAGWPPVRSRARKTKELFTDPSRIYRVKGMGVDPEAYDPQMDIARVERLRDAMARATASMRRRLLRATTVLRQWARARPLKLIPKGL